MPALNKLIDALGLQFNNPTLLQNALAHRSYVHEHYSTTFEPNERLEFLGDAVLNMITAQYLYETYPEYSEGPLTSMRAVLVRTTTLAAFARQFKLGMYIKLGKGEERSGGREREALLADAFEAVMAAIYLDQGLDAARRFLLPLLETQRELVLEQDLLQDDRSHLQERVQAERGETPRYRTISAEGPDHSRMFTVEVSAGEQQLGVGTGASKQAAAQAAARAALLHLDGNNGTEPAVQNVEQPAKTEGLEEPGN
jgi:ribonuclease-3